MNMNQLTRISPSIRGFSRLVLKTQAAKNVCSYAPLRCIASQTNQFSTTSSRARTIEEEQFERRKQLHAQHDWVNLTRVSWQLLAVTVVFSTFFIYLCVTGNKYIVIPFESDRLVLPDHEELHPDKE